jgi:hypothetical protein
MTSPSQEMLDACVKGDVAALRQLFEAHSVQGTEPAYIPSTTGPPPANTMLETAIPPNHLGIVSLILETYPGPFKIRFEGEIIDSLIHNPHLDILQMLYDYDPRIVSFEWDSHTETFVSKACEQPPEKTTELLLWLNEHHANLEAGYSLHPLVKATVGGHELRVFEAMLKNGTFVSLEAMRQVVIFERVDVIKFFLERGINGNKGDGERLRLDAKETGVEEVVHLVGRWTEGWGEGGGCVRGTVGKLRQFFMGKR